MNKVRAGSVIYIHVFNWMMKGRAELGYIFVSLFPLPKLKESSSS